MYARTMALEEAAAVLIQARFRGAQARKIYARKLLEAFENEEAERREKERLQVCEGEVLVERYALQRSIEDDLTLHSNKLRRYHTMAQRIQRAWRKYKRNSMNVPTLKNTFQHQSNPELESLTSLSSAEHSSVSPLSSSIKSSNKPSEVTATNGRHKVTTDYQFSEEALNTKKGMCNGSASVEELARRVNSLISVGPPEMEMFEDFPGSRKPPPPVMLDTVLSNEAQLTLSDVDHTYSLFEPTSHSNFDGDSPEQVSVAMKLKNDDHTNSTSEVLHTNTFTSELIQAPNDIREPTENGVLSIHTQSDIPESVTMPADSDDKYRLLYTIDLSDSSQEDSHASDSILPVYQEPGECEEENMVPASVDQNSTLASSDTLTNTVYPFPFDDSGEKLLQLETPMSFSEEFDIYFPAGSAAAVSLAYNTPNSHPLTHAQVTRGRSKSVGSESSKARTKLDHSKSPLYAMSKRQLSLLLISLERKLKRSSQSLVHQLQERECLKQENGHLHANIARLARKAQQLYS